jgi:hypothetical protein
VLPAGVLPAGVLPAGVLPAGVLPAGSYCQFVADMVFYRDVRGLFAALS